VLRKPPPDAPFEEAAAEFEALLRAGWDLGNQQWNEIKHDWWGAEVMPGTLNEGNE